MTWRDRYRQRTPNSLDAPTGDAAFDAAVKVEVLRRLYDKPRAMGPLPEREQRVIDAVDAAERRIAAPSNVVPLRRPKVETDGNHGGDHAA